MIKTPDCYIRWVFKDSVKFFERARLIGMIEERVGIRMPIISACKVANPSGAIVGMNPKSSLSKML